MLETVSVWYVLLIPRSVASRIHPAVRVSSVSGVMGFGVRSSSVILSGRNEIIMEKAVAAVSQHGVPRSLFVYPTWTRPAGH